MNILITGATSGLGLQLTKDYLAEGHQVFACGRDETKLHGLYHEKNVVLLCFDCLQSTETTTALAEIPNLDLLILNAGTCRYIDDPINLDRTLMQEVIETNISGTLNVLASCLPKLNAGSQLVFISSAATRLPLPRSEIYGASKAAIDYFAKTLAIRLEPKGISTILVQPGFIKTPLTDRNDFPMPWLMSTTEASSKIRDGIHKNQKIIRFPFLLHVVLGGLNLLPSGIWLRLAGKYLSRI